MVLKLCGLMAVLLLLTAESSAAPKDRHDFTITTLSSHPELVTGGDATAFADPTARLLRAAPLRRRLGGAAAARTAERHGFGAAAARLNAILRAAVR